MGLSNAIAGGIMMVSFVIALAIIPDMMDDHMSLNGALSARADLQDSMMKTSIKIQSMTQVQNATGIVHDKVEGVVLNDGLTKLYQYDKFSSFVTYDANQTSSLIPVEECLPGQCTFEKQRITEQLVYEGTGTVSETAIGRGAWVIYSFDELDQHVDPKVVNPGEEFTVRIRTSWPVWNDGGDSLIYCTIATDNGVVASKEDVF